EERGDDPVEAGVVEARLDPHPLGDVAADVDVRTFGRRRPGLVRLLRRIRDVAAEDEGARALDRTRRRDRGSSGGCRCGSRGGTLSATPAPGDSKGAEEYDDSACEGHGLQSGHRISFRLIGLTKIRLSDLLVPSKCSGI